MLTYRESKADKACNLECLQDKPPVHEFIGPVKIVLMDIPTIVYKKKMWLAALIGMANLMIGGTIITIVYFILAMKTELYPTLHIILCTFGFQLFFPMGILMMNNLQGPASQMKNKDHRKHHVIIQMIGWLLVAGGSTLGFITDDGFKLFLTPHALAGLTTAALSVLSVMSGPALFCHTERNDIINCLKGCHVFFAVPTFIASSVCFGLGLFYSKKFNEWLPMVEMLYIPLIFCGLYTLIIIYKPTKKLFSPDLT